MIASVNTRHQLPDTTAVNGTTYYYQVSATNAFVESARSNEKSATPAVAATVPSAPQFVTATRGDRQVVVSWSAPASNGGSSITGYTVRRSGCTTTGALSCTVTGLTNGTTYTFTVTATNAIGTGPWEHPPRPPRPPGPTPPTTRRGRPPSSDQHHAGLDGASEQQRLPDQRATPRATASRRAPAPAPTTLHQSATLSLQHDLPVHRHGDQRRRHQQPVHGVLSGDDEASATTAPSAPQSRYGDASVTGQVTVSWNASGLQRRLVDHRVHPTRRPAVTAARPPARFPAPSPGLTNGTTYTIHESPRPTRSAPAPGASTSATPAARPDPPVLTGATPSATSVTLSWSAPNDNGSPITGYSASGGGQSCTTTGATSCTVNNLSPNTTYSFTVTATNAVGTSNPSTALNATTSAAAPSAPTITAADPGNSITLTWTAPTKTAARGS